MLRALATALLLTLLPISAMAGEFKGSVTISGTGHILDEPDQVMAHASVVAQDDNAARALDMARKRVTTVKEKMAPFGVVTASRIYLEQGRSKSTRLIGSDDPAFNAYGTVTLTLADPDKAGEALDMLVRSDINGMARLEYGMVVTNVG